MVIRWQYNFFACYDVIQNLLTLHSSFILKYNFHSTTVFVEVNKVMCFIIHVWSLVVRIRSLLSTIISYWVEFPFILINTKFLYSFILINKWIQIIVFCTIINNSNEVLVTIYYFYISKIINIFNCKLNQVDLYSCYRVKCWPYLF